MRGRKRHDTLADDPREWSVAAIAEELGYSVRRLDAALGSIDKHGYQQFALVDAKKRRAICKPLPWLKELQQRAYQSILKRLPISPAAYCRPGGGVVQNARQHMGQAYLTVLDVADCFPSTDMRMVRAALQDLGIPADVAGILTRLTTYHGFLPQGPPTSPAILNLVFRRIDDELTALAKRHRAVYTRYMDDLAFSGAHPLKQLSREAVRVLRRFGYSSNPAKRREWGPSDRHTITKIVVSTTLNPTPEFLAALCRHLSELKNGNCRLTEDQLRGKIAWVIALNPTLGRSLEARHRRLARTTSNSLGRAA